MGVGCMEELPLLDIVEHPPDPLVALRPHDEVVKGEAVLADVVVEEVVHVSVLDGERFAGGVYQGLAGFLNLERHVE